MLTSHEVASGVVSGHSKVCNRDLSELPLQLYPAPPLHWLTFFAKPLDVHACYRHIKFHVRGNHISFRYSNDDYSEAVEAASKLGHHVSGWGESDTRDYHTGDTTDEEFDTDLDAETDFYVDTDNEDVEGIDSGKPLQ